MTGASRRTRTRRRARSLEALLGLGLLGSVGYILSRRWAAGSSSEGESQASRPQQPPTSSQPQSSQPSKVQEPSEPPATSAGSSQETDEAGDSSDRTVSTDRLTLDEIGAGDLDGVWWPTTTTAAEAIPQLVNDLPEGLGRVTRIALPMPDWSDEQPKTVTVDDHQVHVAWFTGMRRRTARVTFDTDVSATVLVLPPDAEQDTATEALKASAEERSRSGLLGTDSEWSKTESGEIPSDEAESDDSHESGSGRSGGSEQTGDVGGDSHG